ncbi:hypothetical protein WJX73_004660 [Symbiochloris irregularis]|uniref:Uncharacterized protein n=1 Tax=Symbiochloris irregularis TaxID=706552 RepID=A0AAW1NUC6_9CHLO
MSGSTGGLAGGQALDSRKPDEYDRYLQDKFLQGSTNQGLSAEQPAQSSFASPTKDKATPATVLSTALSRSSILRQWPAATKEGHHTRAPAAAEPSKVSGFSPQPGYPRDADASEAAIGGGAAVIAPLAAAAASGHPEGGRGQEGLDTTAPDLDYTAKPESGGGYVDSALAAGSAALAAVGDQVSKVVGKPNTAAAATPEELAATPQQGYPASASPKEAATGGAAGYIAPEAAEAAKHTPHDQGFEQSADPGTAAHQAPSSASAGGILGSTLAAGSATAAAVGNKLSNLVGSNKPDTQLEDVQGGRASERNRAQNALATEDFAGGHSLPVETTGTAQASGADTTPSTGGIVESTLAAGSAAAAVVSNKVADLIDSVSGTGGAKEGQVEGLNPPVGQPRDAPASEAAVGGEAASIAPVAAAVASGVPEDQAQASTQGAGAGNDRSVLAKAADAVSGGGLHRGKTRSRSQDIDRALSDEQGASAARPSPDGLNFGQQRYSKGPALPEDVSRQLEPVKSPVVILGVVVVLITLSMCVPMWMWVTVFGLAGALYVVNMLNNHQGKPHTE